MSTCNADVARLAVTGHSYSTIAEMLGIPPDEVTRRCSRLRQRGLVIPRSNRIKLIAVCEKTGEKYEFFGAKDCETRGGYCYKSAHRAAQCGGKYLGMIWSKKLTCITKQ